MLYQVIEEYWPGFKAELASHGKYLPTFISREYDEYLKCSRLEHGFIRRIEDARCYASGSPSQ